MSAAVPVELTGRGGLPRRFATNVTMNYIASFTAIVSGFVVTPLILHRLGDDAFGVWALAGSATAYLELFEFGFGVSTTKLLAEDAGERPERALQTLNTSFYVLSVLGAAALVVGAVLALVAPDLFHVHDALRQETIIVWLLLAATIAISIPGDTLGGALAGFQRYDLLSASNLALVALTGAASIVVVVAGGGLVALAVVTSVISVAMHGLRWVLLRPLMPDLRLTRRLVDRARVREIAGLSGWFLVRDVASTVIFRVDLVVVGLVLDVRAVAVFAIGSKLAQLSDKTLVPLSQVFLPHASALDRDRDTVGLAALLTDGTRAAMVPGVPATLVLTLLAARAIPAWVGHGYHEAIAITIVLSIALGLRSMTTTAWHLLAGAGQARVSAYIAIAEAVVNLAASIVLAYAMGPIGVAVGTLIGALAVRVPAAVVIACRRVGLPIRSFVRRAVLPHLPATAITAAVLLGAHAVIPARPVAVLGAAVVGAAVYVASYLSIGAPRADRMRVAGLLSSARQRLARAGKPA